MIIEMAADYCGKDKQSNLFKVALTSNYLNADCKDFKVIGITMETSVKGKYQRPYTLSSTSHYQLVQLKRLS